MFSLQITSIFLLIYGVFLSLNLPKIYYIASLLLVMIYPKFQRSLDFIVKKFVKTDLTTKRQSVVNTVCSLKDYERKTKLWNNKRRLQLNQLPSKHYEMAKELSYWNKIDKVDQAITTNASLINKIANFAVEKYSIEPSELRAGVASSPNYRIIESLCHYLRDWTNDSEIEPILRFYKDSLQQLRDFDVNIRKENTVIVIPGSGLGRIAHELALEKWSSVFAVEYSMLMNLFNEFIYQEPFTKIPFHPYLHSYSHHVSLEQQLRKAQLRKGISKPKKLKLIHGDFRDFSVPKSTETKNIILVTEFFLDTAENVFEYMDSIDKVSEGLNAYWINLGPLKYGSKPKIEPTLNEWKQIRKMYNWIDIKEEDPIKNDLVGYLTNKESLWQGYYGVARWTCKKSKKNFV